MRLLAVVVVALLAGCFGRCEDRGYQATWHEPSAYEALVSHGLGEHIEGAGLAFQTPNLDSVMAGHYAASRVERREPGLLVTLRTDGSVQVAAAAETSAEDIGALLAQLTDGDVTAVADELAAGVASAAQAGDVAFWSSSDGDFFAAEAELSGPYRIEHVATGPLRWHRGHAWMDGNWSVSLAVDKVRIEDAGALVDVFAGGHVHAESPDLHEEGFRARMDGLLPVPLTYTDFQGMVQQVCWD